MNAPREIDQLGGPILSRATTDLPGARALRADPPSPLAGDNSLPDLAARIRAEHAATSSALKSSVEHAMVAGDLLIEAKVQLQHGEWLPWLRDHCAISERTAQRYVKLARNRELVEQNATRVSDLGVNAALALLAVPRQSSEELSEESTSSGFIGLAERAALVALDGYDLEHPEEERDREVHRSLVHEAMATVEKIGQLLASIKPELAQRIDSETAEYSERIAALASDCHSATLAEMGLTELEHAEFFDYVERCEAEGKSTLQIASTIDHKFFAHQGRRPNPSARMALYVAMHDVANEWLNRVEQLVSAGPP